MAELSRPSEEEESEEHIHVDEQQSLLVENADQTGSKDEDYDDIPYLSGRPFFDMVFTKSHVSPRYNLLFPVRIARDLPHATVPAVLRYNRKNWDLSYIGNSPCPRFSSQWKQFVTDNNLVAGDACVFEIMECSGTLIKFKVHILRHELPPELEEKLKSFGTSENPIFID